MYSPKIKDTQVKALYLLRERLKTEGIKKPMTILVSEAVEEYLKKKTATPKVTKDCCLKKVI